MPFALPKVYSITDARLSGLTHAEQVESLCAGGAHLIQLREKLATPSEFYQSALSALNVAGARGLTLIINDRVDIALALKADGVHLGQDDLPPEAARRLLGASALIGFSTHNLEQAAAAALLPVDYIAIGPVYDTQTKADPDRTVGLEGVRAVRRAVGAMPLVAIGGITMENARAVLEAGADSVAVIGAILARPLEIERRMREFLAALSS